MIVTSRGVPSKFLQVAGAFLRLPSSRGGRRKLCGRAQRMALGLDEGDLPTRVAEQAACSSGARSRLFGGRHFTTFATRSSSSRAKRPIEGEHLVEKLARRPDERRARASSSAPGPSPATHRDRCGRALARRGLGPLLAETAGAAALDLEGYRLQAVARRYGGRGCRRGDSLEVRASAHGGLASYPPLEPILDQAEAFPEFEALLSFHTVAVYPSRKLRSKQEESAPKVTQGPLPENRHFLPYFGQFY